MLMGQVWSKADFDGLIETGHQGGHGSVLAVTAQNPGRDKIYGTDDDVLEPLNRIPTTVAIDWAPGSSCTDSRDRVRGFYSFHSGGANFLRGDGSVSFVNEAIDTRVYQAASTIAAGEMDLTP